MSSMFKPPREFDPSLVKVMLQENAILIKIIAEYQNKGRIQECMKYHDILTRNLLYLSGQADFHADENFSPTRNPSSESSSHTIHHIPYKKEKLEIENFGEFDRMKPNLFLDNSSCSISDDKSLFFNFK